ncbi:MAG TPA: ParB/RepB/Spo0J family partition protein [Bryobacteraceae bacterium]|nr:ParB/RepB/Spo0J family partition protein [Bryobacteraceae bacterium]
MSKNRDQRRALGKGLSALLPSRQIIKPEPQPHGASISPLQQQITQESGLKEIPIDSIEPNPLQPRSIFEPEKLAELAQSIRSNGIIQPLVVQRHGDKFQLVAGERRWRAARMAGLDKIPVVVRDFADERLLEIALVENIQRQDLNPIEVAQALDRLGRELKLSHEQIGERTGKDRATVSNLIRLLRLPTEVQLLVAENKLAMGHARAILGLPDEASMTQVAARAASTAMSVRQLEKLIQHRLAMKSIDAEATPVATDPNVMAATRELESALGTKVRIVSETANKGRIEIQYYSVDDLDRIYKSIIGED